MRVNDLKSDRSVCNCVCVCIYVWTRRVRKQKAITTKKTVNGAMSKLDDNTQSLGDINILELFPCNHEKLIKINVTCGEIDGEGTKESKNQKKFARNIKK